MIIPAAEVGEVDDRAARDAGGPHRYRAPDFDTLADSPIVLGNPAVYEFTVDGKKHYLVNEGEGGVFDGARAAKDLEAIVREHRRMWGSLPYDKYLFLNLLTEAGGGLEHKNSTVLMASRWATRTRRAYVAWLELASHEFFHAWNVKRLRPVELGPFDYENEVHTKSLWIAEGVHRLLRRSGRAPRRAVDARRVPRLAVGQDRGAADDARAGWCSRSELASFDAWIKYYRPDENSLNTSISYYTKGAVVAFLLDARIRKLTNGAQEPRRRDARRLRQVLRHARATPPTSSAPSPSRWPAPASRRSGTRRSPARRSWTTAEALDVVRPALPLRGGAGGPARPRVAGRRPRATTPAGCVVSQVRRDTPAAEAGLNVDDEILAIGDFRVRADRLDNRLEQYRPGDAVTLLVARREQLLRLELTFGTEPARAWRLEVHPSATDGQQSARHEVADGRQGVSQPRQRRRRGAQLPPRAGGVGAGARRACTCSRNTSAEAEPRTTCSLAAPSSSSC